MSDSFIFILDERLKKHLKYSVIGYDMVLDRYQYLLYNTKCGNTNLFSTRSVT